MKVKILESCRNGQKAGLPKPVEFGQVHAELAQDLEEEGRADPLSSMNWDGDGPPVRVDPALVTARRTGELESEPAGDSLKLERRGARHARFR